MRRSILSADVRSIRSLVSYGLTLSYTAESDEQLHEVMDSSEASGRRPVLSERQAAMLEDRRAAAKTRLLQGATPMQTSGPLCVGVGIQINETTGTSFVCNGTQVMCCGLMVSVLTRHS